LAPPCRVLPLCPRATRRSQTPRHEIQERKKRRAPLKTLPPAPRWRPSLCLPTCLVPIRRPRPVCARDHPQSSASSSTRVLTPHHICHDRCSNLTSLANLGFVDCEQAHNPAPPTLGRPTPASRTLTTAEKPTAKLKAWGRDVCRDPTWELLSVPVSRATSICQNLLLLNPRGTLRKSHLRPSMPSLCATSAQIDKMGLSMG
jgi:hypothetical protein